MVSSINCLKQRKLPYLNRLADVTDVCQRRLYEGLVEGCLLKRDVAKDAVLTYDDVILPPGRLADRLRAEQYRVFRGETWLEEVMKVNA